MQLNRGNVLRSENQADGNDSESHWDCPQQRPLPQENRLRRTYDWLKGTSRYRGLFSDENQQPAPNNYNGVFPDRRTVSSKTNMDTNMIGTCVQPQQPWLALSSTWGHQPLATATIAANPAMPLLEDEYPQLDSRQGSQTIFSKPVRPSGSGPDRGMPLLTNLLEHLSVTPGQEALSTRQDEADPINQLSGVFSKLTTEVAAPQAMSSEEEMPATVDASEGSASAQPIDYAVSMYNVPGPSWYYPGGSSTRPSTDNSLGRSSGRTKSTADQDPYIADRLHGKTSRQDRKQKSSGRREQTELTAKQLLKLNFYWSCVDRRPSTTDRKRLAAWTKLEPQDVKIWFQNKRLIAEKAGKSVGGRRTN